MDTSGSGRLQLRDRLQVFLTAVYIPLAGVFWFGDVSPTLLARVKLVLFGTLLLLAIVHRQPVTAALGRLVCGLAICAVGAFGANFITGDIRVATMAASDFLEPALWLLALSAIRPVAYASLFRALTVGLIASVLLALVPVAVLAGVAPNLYPPDGFVDVVDANPSAVQEATSVLAGGFTGSRTGWGAIVALSAIMLAALLTRASRVSSSRLVIVLLVFMTAMAGIAVTGARAGALTLAVIALYGLLWRLPVSLGGRAAILGLLTGAWVLWLLADLGIELPYDLTRGLGEGRAILEILGSASTGRLETYVWALEQFSASPVYGVGQIQSLTVVASGEVLAPHNVWLRILAQGGLLAFIPTALVTLQLVGLALTRTLRSSDARAGRGIAEQAPDVAPTILAGLIIAMAEPSVVFGSMNSNAVFWTAVGIALARPYSRSVSLSAAWFRELDSKAQVSGHGPSLNAATR